MININLKSLVDKMSPYMRDSLEGAAGLCLAHSQYNVELEHWLLKLLDISDTDFVTLLEKHDVNPGNVAKQLAGTISRFRSGSSRPAALAPSIVEAAKNAWMLASVDYAQPVVSSGHLLAALLLEDSTRRQLLESCPELKEIAPESIRETARAIFGTTGETDSLVRGNEPGSEGGQAGPVSASKTPALDKYTVNLTERAQSGQIDPVLGRDEEIRQCIDILTRRRQNNPIMTGEAGVGKTAVVEGFALRIAAGDVPEPLKGVAVRTLDLGLLQAGASVKGEFENRLKSVIEEVRASVTPIILFIDEAHTMIGAGGKEGQGDAANLLKPALARGELHCVGATTLDEYRKNVEKDAALARRFQPVFIAEPTVEDTISILRGIKEKYELHHGVRITDSALVSAATLSNRYITDRFLPDKAIDLMDEAGSRLRMQVDSKPEELDELDRRIIQLKIEREALKKETDKASKDRLEKLETDLSDLEEKADALTARWMAEKDKLSGTRDLKEELDHARSELEIAQRDGDLAKAGELSYGVIPQLEQRINEAEGDEDADAKAMVEEAVTPDHIAHVVSRWTGIPVDKMLEGEREKLLKMEDEIGERVVGQGEAVQAVSKAVRRSRAGLQDPNRPMGSFIFLGPTGVGKTELTKALADYLFDDDSAMVRLDMSEYMEKHSVSRLIGAPPGYVGYEEGGALTEAVRRRPYQVVLFDEIEKAHPDVFNVLLQVLDDGRLTDGQGRTVDFRNTLIIMTSNIGAEFLVNLKDDEDVDAVREPVMDMMKASFRPEFLNRVDETILFHRLKKSNMAAIVKIQLKRLEALLEDRKVVIELDKDALNWLADKGYDPAYGARPLKRVIQSAVQDPLAEKILAGEIPDGATIGVTSGTDKLQFRVKGSKKAATTGDFEVQDTDENRSAA